MTFNSKPMEYGEWYEKFDDALYAEYMESGADGELDNPYDDWVDDRYDEYYARCLENQADQELNDL